MDSKLVVEQMAGRWKIKHPSMKPLALQAEQAPADGGDLDLGAARAEQACRRTGQHGSRRRAGARGTAADRLGSAMPARSRPARRRARRPGSRPGCPARRRSRSRPTSRPRSSRAAERAAAHPGCPSWTGPTSSCSPSTRPGSRDLDQALHIARRPGGGYVVSYAIADVAAFVTAGRPGRPGGAPPRHDPLRPRPPDAAAPPVLSEGAASLLPDQVRPALLWTITLDARGRDDRRRGAPGPGPQPRAAHLRAGPGRDRRRLAARALALLREVGQLREQRERERGGVSLQIPEQEIQADGGRLGAALPGAAAGRGLERPDLAAHRDGGRAHHALRPGRHPADHAAGRPGLAAPAAADGQGAAHPLAGRAGLSRVRPQPRPRRARRTPRC